MQILEQERNRVGVYTSSRPYRIQSAGWFQQDQGASSSGKRAWHGQHCDHRSWSDVRSDRFLQGSESRRDQTDHWMRDLCNNWFEIR